MRLFVVWKSTASCRETVGTLFAFRLACFSRILDWSTRSSNSRCLQCRFSLLVVDNAALLFAVSPPISIPLSLSPSLNFRSHEKHDKRTQNTPFRCFVELIRYYQRGLCGLLREKCDIWATLIRKRILPLGTDIVGVNQGTNHC